MTKLLFSFIAALVFWAAPTQAVTEQVAQACVTDAIKLAKVDLNTSVSRHLNMDRVIADAHPHWTRLSHQDRRKAARQAQSVMSKNLKKYGFGLWLTKIEVEKIKPHGQLSLIEGKVTVILLFGRPFSAYIDNECRVQQVYLLTQKHGWRSLSQWLAEQEHWPP